ncbi:MAG: SDR family oxidoreductase [Candidatus Nanopelagicaceae bacterium]|nr:SDR family oxidoreductase [Candidatus Nanopelagicaceae bacterium]
MTKEALVVGVTGIAGNNIAQELLKAGFSVHGLTRKAGITIPGVHHIYADVLDPVSLQQAIADIDITHLFFCTWSRQNTETENIKVNGAMLQNTLDAIKSKKSMEHAVLITGLKHYLGPFESYAATPMETPFKESQPRLPIENFYYTQEDILFKAAAEQGYSWSVHRPHTMIGWALGNAMNMGVTLAVYASICKETGKPFVFPGSKEQFNGVTDVTDARLLARHAVWSATAPAAENEAFNTVNGDVFRWRQLWKLIAEYFGLQDPGYPSEMMPLEPRMVDADEIWSGIVSKYELASYKASDIASWWHTDADLGRQVETFADMGKSRKAGFREVQVTPDSFFDLFDQLRAAKIIPPQ